MPGMNTALIALLSATLTGAAVWFYARSREQENLLRLNDQTAQERSALTAELATAKAQLAAQIEQQAQLREQLQLWFENATTRMVSEGSAQLQAKSEQSLAALLMPVREHLTTFEKKVDEVYNNEARERVGLQKHIELALQFTQQTSTAANNLTAALKGDAKKRGNWGEMQLENILKDTGMQEGTDYYLQGRGFKLKDESGRRQLPDFIVRMPHEQHVIIDSKVTLNSYADYVDSANGDEVTQQAAAQQFIAAIRRHIDELSAKKYAEQDELNAHSLVLMFIPIESALGAALDLDRNLLTYARSKNITLIGPSGLMVALTALHAVLQSERLERNANEIAREAAGLYDKLRGAIESLNSVGKYLDQADTAYKKALGQLASGPGNVLRRVEAFRSRGVSVTKPLGQLDHLPDDTETPELETATPLKNVS